MWVQTVGKDSRFARVCHLIAALVIVAGASVGCETYTTREAELWKQRESGKISKADYEAQLKFLHENTPQGAGALAPDPPIVGQMGGWSSDDVAANQLHHH
jgi:hypothetical protein